MNPSKYLKFIRFYLKNKKLNDYSILKLNIFIIASSN